MKTINFPFAMLLLALLMAGPLSSIAQQWQHVPDLPSLEMTALFAAGDTLYVAGINKIYFTHDEGNQWDSTAVIHPEVDFIEAVSLVKGRLFAGTVTHGVFRSDNAGQSWQADNTGLSGAGATAIVDFAVRGDSLYVGTGGAGVFVKKISSNSAWSSYNLNMPWFNIFSLTNIDGKLYAGAGGSATFALQSSPGHGWTEKSFAVFDGSLNALLGVVKQGNVLLSAGMAGLYRSTDGGENWTHFNPGTGVLGTSRLVIDGGQVIANLAKPVGFSFIKTSTDQGLSWQNFEPEITGSFGHDIALMNGVLYSARSNGLWRIALTTPVEETPVPLAEVGPNFPNPFNGRTTIPVRLGLSGRAEFSVFDAQGSVVKTLWQGTQAAGNYKLEFDADNLPAGVYFGRLTTSAGIYTQRMVLIK